MVVKIYISGISGNKEVKKRQQRVLMILDSKNIKYDVIDITEPGKEADKDFMQNNSKSNGGTVSDPNPRSPLPPQVFNDDEYCGDYDQFDLANEVDTLEQFLKVEVPPEEPAEPEKESNLNGDLNKESKENSQEREAGGGDTTEKEGTPLRESTPAEDKSASKEASPEKEEEAKESYEKESTPVREQSVEKEEAQEDAASAPASKETSPEKEGASNENGTVSSREQSAEKDTGEVTSKSPSEALISSEQSAAAE